MQPVTGNSSAKNRVLGSKNLPIQIPPFSVYYEVLLGNGQLFFDISPKTPCHVNDPNADLINFYKKVTQPELKNQLRLIAENWMTVGQFSNFCVPELFVSFQDFSDSIITLEDINYMVRAIIIMNTDNEAFSTLFNQQFHVSVDMFTNALISQVVDAFTKLKGEFTQEPKAPRAFYLAIETAFRTGFYNHMQQLINLQETKLIDCITNDRHLAIWYFLSKTSKGSKVNYDDNGNLKNQYGGENYNQCDLLNDISFFNSPSFNALMGNTQLHNLTAEAFIKSITCTPNDLIVANFENNNLISSNSTDAIIKNKHQQVVNLLINTNAQWLVISDNKSLTDEFKNSPDIQVHEFSVNGKTYITLSNF